MLIIWFDLTCINLYACVSRWCCLELVIATQVTRSCRLQWHSTILGRGWYRGCQGADGDSSMCWTMTTLTGWCMQLVGAQGQQSLARGIVSLHQTMMLPKRSHTGTTQPQMFGPNGNGGQRMTCSWMVQSLLTLDHPLGSFHSTKGSLWNQDLELWLIG